MLDLSQQHDDEVSRPSFDSMPPVVVTDGSGHHSHLNHLQRLATTFCRGIFGIHNQTHGPVADILYSILSPSLRSQATIPLIDQLRLALLSTQTKKVILVAHGTGTIHEHSSRRLTRRSAPRLHVEAGDLHLRRSI